MDELKMTQEEFEILDRILSGRLHKRERLEVIALIDKEGFSRRPEPLVRGMEIDVEALAEVIFKSQMKIAGLMNTWNQATPALKSIYIDQAKYYVANAHVWLKEVEKGK